MQKSICQRAQLKQVFPRADEVAILSGSGRGEICPVCRHQRLTSVRQNENELQAVVHTRVPEDLQRLSFKWVMRTRDRYPLRVVPGMGSLWWFPLTK